MANSNSSTTPTTKSNNSILTDRGCDLDTGRYYARVGAEYKTFFSSEIRDQWFNTKLSEVK